MRFIILFLLITSNIFSDIVILSPHLDDGSLSLAGYITQNNQTNHIKMINVFTISDFIQTFPIINDISKVTKIRKNEEQKVSKALNYESICLDYLDKPLRADYNKKETNIMISNIKRDIINNISKDDTILAPLCCQKIIHPDHLIIHNIALELKNEGYKVKWYEELPYVDWGGFNVKKLEKVYYYELIPIDIFKKLSVLRLYSSQVTIEWLNIIKKYSHFLVPFQSYERIWY
ncbi:MAG: PIG-L family deacetylase [Bryobacteraceae bacterium]